MRLGMMSFNRVPMNVVAASILASYAAQFLALLQGFPLCRVTCATADARFSYSSPRRSSNSDCGCGMMWIK